MSVAPEQRYDTTSIVLHWLVALLVAALWVGGETIGWFAPGALRGDVRSLHIALGTLLGMIGGIRVAWRLSFGSPVAPMDSGLMGAAAKLTHQGLYALLAMMVILGMEVLWASGDSAFNTLSLDPLSVADQALTGKLQHWHGLIGWAIVITVGLHVAAVLFHQILLRDGLMRRMLPR